MYHEPVYGWLLDASTEKEPNSFRGRRMLWQTQGYKGVSLLSRSRDGAPEGLAHLCPQVLAAR